MITGKRWAQDLERQQKDHSGLLGPFGERHAINHISNITKTDFTKYCLCNGATAKSALFSPISGDTPRLLGPLGERAPTKTRTPQ